MKYISLFSGIEAATMAWKPIGWQALAYAEMEKFPSAVLQHRYPKTPNHGDVTKFDWSIYHGKADLIVFGSPCQSFSVAGKRLGLDDPRGNLALFALGVVKTIRPRWFLFENVPGLLSSGQGRDFGAFLAAVGECGYQCAWRVLDAQYFGVAQRRRRVFVIGYLGDWRYPASVLFERESLRGDTPPRREKGPGVARSLTSSTGGCSAKEQQYTFIGKDGKPLNALPDTAWCLQERDAKGPDSDTKEGHLIPMAFGSKDSGADVLSNQSPTLRAGGHSKSHANSGVPPAVVYDMRGNGEGDITPTLTGDHLNRPTDYTPIALQDIRAGIETKKQNGRGWNADGAAYTLDGVGAQGVAQVQWASGGGKMENPTMQALRSGAEHNYQFLRTGTAVRRLTPRECERLQGFPDDYTLIPYRGGYAADGPRYKALGNSMAVPVMHWLGRRIDTIQKILERK